MRNSFDFSSWSAVLSTLLGLVLVSLVAVGVRLVFMQTLQRRRERENRQINERLKTLIAAYKTLGGSFTGNLEVDPSHLRDLKRRARAEGDGPGDDIPEAGSSERRRRIRDAVEAALSDVILLGTQEQVRLAVQAANEMVAGRTVHVAPLVASLRGFIREALDLEEIPADLSIPAQGPLRSGGSGGAGTRRPGGGNEGGGARGGGGGQGGAGAGGVGLGMGMGAAGGLHHASGRDADHNG